MYALVFLAIPLRATDFDRFARMDPEAVEPG